MKKIIYLTLVIAFFSCGSEKNSESAEKEKEPVKKEFPNPTGLVLKDLHFMEGNWHDASGQMQGFTEKWVIQNDSLIQVIGFFTNGADTAIMEVIKVKMDQGILHYIPKVENENEGKEVPFALQSWSTSDSLVFANYEHDFPQEICYAKKTNDSVVVYLKGIDEKKQPKNYLLILKRAEQ